MSQQLRPQQSVQALFLRGMAWKLGSQLTLQILRLGIVVALARLVAPSQYGLAAMALVLTTFVITFSDVGLGAALVQRPHLTEADRSTAFWLSLAAGAIFTGGIAALAGPIASFYGHPQARPLIQVLSLVFVIGSCSATHRALLAKEMNFRSLELRTLAGTVVGGGVGIAVAAKGGGAWALIAQEIALGVTSTFALWMLSDWRPRLLFSVTSLRELMGFSANTVGSRVLDNISATADNILIGRFLGAGPLGLYAITYKTVLTPLGRVALPVQEVLFPALARLQSEPERLRQAWLRATKFSVAAAAPMLIGLALVAPDFTDVVLGRKWHRAAPVMQILVVVGLAQAMQATGWSALAARNRTRTQLRFSIAATSMNVSAFAIGLHWGLHGVAVCYAISSIVLLVIYTRLTTAIVGVSALAYLATLRGVALSITAMAASVLGVREALMHQPAALRLVICIPVGILAFAATVAAGDREIGNAIREVWVRRHRRGRSRPFVTPPLPESRDVG